VGGFIDSTGLDVNGDGKIGMAEMMNILKKAAALM